MLALEVAFLTPSFEDYAPPSNDMLDHFGQGFADTDLFSLSEAKRDAEIAYARKTHTWRRIMNPDDDDEDATPPSSGRGSSGPLDPMR